MGMTKIVQTNWSFVLLFSDADCCSSVGAKKHELTFYSFLLTSWFATVDLTSSSLLLQIDWKKSGSKYFQMD